MLTERDVERMDYYELLGLGHLAMRCNGELIKKACESNGCMDGGVERWGF